jgi:hypothetical protein
LTGSRGHAGELFVQNTDKTGQVHQVQTAGRVRLMVGQKVMPKDLGDRAKDCLALYVLAALHVERFPDGSVAQEDFGKYTLNLPPETAPEALDRALRRAKEEIEALLEPVSIDPVSGKGPRRRRIRTVSENLRQWLFDEGKKHIVPALWDEFKQPKEVIDSETVRAATHQALVNKWLKQGKFGEVLFHVEWILPMFKSPVYRADLLFAAGIAHLEWGSQRNRALDIFHALLDEQSKATRPDEVFAARVKVYLSRAEINLLAKPDLEACLSRTDEALKVLPAAYYRERAMAKVVQATAMLHYAEQTSIVTERRHYRTRREELLREALLIARHADDDVWDGPLAFLLAEVQYERWQDETLSDAALEDILRNYEAVLAYDEQSGRPYVMGRAVARAGECLIELIARALSHDDVEKIHALIEGAKGYLPHLQNHYFLYEADAELLVEVLSMYAPALVLHLGQDLRTKEKLHQLRKEALSQLRAPVGEM